MTSYLIDLAGKCAVVTGGTSGIGRALSLGLADAGAAVVASARRQQQVDETADEIEARGGQTLRLASDVWLQHSTASEKLTYSLTARAGSSVHRP